MKTSTLVQTGVSPEIADLISRLGVCRTFMSCHYPSWQNIVSEHIKIIRKRTINHCACTIIYVLSITISSSYL